MNSTLLDSKLRRTGRKEDALFVETDRMLRLDNVELLHDSRRYYEIHNMQANPIGYPRAREDQRREWKVGNETILLTFDSIQKAWACESKHVILFLSPACDQSDATLFIENFRKLPEIEAPAGQPFKIYVGNQLESWEPITSVAQAKIHRGEISFHNDPQNNHLIACGMALATKDQPQEVSLKRLILHELIHLLEPQMQGSLHALTYAIVAEPTQVEKAVCLNPQYLPTCLKLWRKQRTAPKTQREVDETLAAEILCEAAATLILEKVCKQGKSQPLKTGWDALDKVINELEQNHSCLLRGNAHLPGKEVTRTTYLLPKGADIQIS